MARVSLDGKVWKDPRVKRLARRRSWSLRETIGTLAAVWDVAYDNKTPIMPRIDVDTAAEADQFAADMIAEDLATAIGEDLVSVRLRGVTERIQYLLDQAARGRMGGLVRAAGAKRGPSGQLQADAKQVPGERQAFAEQPPALPIATPSASASADPDPTDEPVALARSASGKRTRKPKALTPIDLAWSPRQEERDLADSLSVDADAEAIRFRNHHGAKGTELKDWNLAFNNWLRRAKEYAPRQQASNAGRYEPSDKAVDWAAEAERVKREGF